jgi:Integrase core domain
MARSSRDESRAWTAARSSPPLRAPWQNPFVERVIGSIRRECLDHFLILNETHLYRLLRAYVAYYNTTRPHQSLDNNSPLPRVIDPCQMAGSSPFLRSAGFITVTSAPPDQMDTAKYSPARHPPRQRRLGCRFVCQPTPAAATATHASPASSCGLHISGSEDAASDPERLNPPWHHRDTGR